MRSDFPDYELPDHTTKRRKLSELQGQHPMVLVLSRGGFCPKERQSIILRAATMFHAFGRVLPVSRWTNQRSST
jgi:peroxiredoxin